jgi:hypothetical protein
MRRCDPAFPPTTGQAWATRAGPNSSSIVPKSHPPRSSTPNKSSAAVFDRGERGACRVGSQPTRSFKGFDHGEQARHGDWATATGVDFVHHLSRWEYRLETEVFLSPSDMPKGLWRGFVFWATPKLPGLLPLARPTTEPMPSEPLVGAESSVSVVDIAARRAYNLTGKTYPGGCYAIRGDDEDVLERTGGDS